MAKTPDSIKSHSGDYKDRSWMDYTIPEYGNWVYLLAKRAFHRSSIEKARKDLTDAQNYLNMMQERLNAIKEDIESVFNVH